MSKYFPLCGLLILLFLVACSTAPATSEPMNTPDAVQAYVNANASQATAVAAVATAQYYTGGLTATADAHNQAATEQAFGLQATQQAENIQATERSWDATSTAGAAQATQFASGTATANAVESLSDQQAVNVTATAAQGLRSGLRH